MTKDRKTWSLKLLDLDKYSSKIQQDIMIGNRLVGSLTYELNGFRVWYKYSKEAPPFRQTIFQTYGEAIRAIEEYINE